MHHLLTALAKDKTHVINGARSEVKKRQKVSGYTKTSRESPHHCINQKSTVILGISHIFSILGFFELGALHSVCRHSDFMHTRNCFHKHCYSFVHVSVHRGHQIHRFQATFLHRRQSTHHHRHQHQRTHQPAKAGTAPLGTPAQA